MTKEGNLEKLIFKIHVKIAPLEIKMKVIKMNSANYFQFMTNNSYPPIYKNQDHHEQ